MNGKGMVLGKILVVMLIFVLIAIVMPTVSAVDGLVAYYPFNGNANDESGNGNHGTVHGATWVDNGNCRKALSFDGREDSVQIPHTVINNLLDLTFSAWIKTSDCDVGILTGANSGDHNEFLIFISEGKLKPHVKSEAFLSE